MDSFKFYHASFYGSRDHWTALERAKVKRILLNYSDIGRFDWTFILGYREAGIEICLDSGAFSVWTGGASDICIDEYITFVREVGQHCFNPIFSLDKIAGRPGYIRRTREEIEEAAEISYSNYQTMKRAGLVVLPTYHAQEEPRHLFRLLDDGEEYVACSPYKKHTKDRQARWLRNVFGVVDGSAKLHGLGVGDHETLSTFPFYSADSTSWARSGIAGSIIVPNETGFGVEPYRICTSSGNPKSVDRWPCKKEHVFAWLSECGTDLSGVRKSSTERMLCNAVYYRELENHINEHRMTT